jgi:hypothetical protein
MDVLLDGLYTYTSEDQVQHDERLTPAYTLPLAVNFTAQAEGIHTVTVTADGRSRAQTSVSVTIGEAT